MYIINNSFLVFLFRCGLFCFAWFCFHFYPLALFRHCFLPRINYVCFFLFSFWIGVIFPYFHHNCSWNKLQVCFLSRSLNSNDIFYFCFFWLSNTSFVTFPLFSYISFSLSCCLFFC